MARESNKRPRPHSLPSSSAAETAKAKLKSPARASYPRQTDAAVILEDSRHRKHATITASCKQQEQPSPTTGFRIQRKPVPEAKDQHTSALGDIKAKQIKEPAGHPALIPIEGSPTRQSSYASKRQIRSQLQSQTRSAEARALYVEAKSHYSKAGSHLLEALRLSGDVIKLAPHVIADNSGHHHYERNEPVKQPIPEYPGLGIDYRPLLSQLGRVSRMTKDERLAKGLQKGRKERETALAKERTAVARKASATGSGSSSLRKQKTGSKDGNTGHSLLWFSSY